MRMCEVASFFSFSPSSKLCGCYLVIFFMFSNFYQLDLHNTTRVVLVNLR